MIVRIATSQRDFFRLVRLREAVFVVEQQVPIEIELDDEDDRAIHVIADEGADLVGTARLIIKGHSGKIGRMAVDRRRRRGGVGTALIDFIKEESRQWGLSDLVLHAQAHAVPFYERLGFSAEGAAFEEAGIPHRRMVFRLK